MRKSEEYGGVEMDFEEVVRARRSVRKYESRDIGKEKLDALLEAVCSAPSAGNMQAYEVVLVTDAANREALSMAASDKPFIKQAPVSMVFCANRATSGSRFGERGKQLYAVQDATIAAAYAQLAATSLGLATVWAGNFDPRLVASAIGAKNDVEPVAIITLGYPAEIPLPNPKRPVSDIVSKEKLNQA
jgi:nitroreductase